MSSSITMRRVKVTPRIAKTWLESNTSNRRLRESKVRKMARDMTKGEWHESHQAIAFNCDGTLKDGQHRLNAVMLSGVPQYFWVAKGLSNMAALHIDTHAPRSDADAFTIDGMATGKREVAVAKQMFCGAECAYTDQLSREELRLFILEHSEAIAFATAVGVSRRYTSSPILAVVGRAFYHVDAGKLERFKRVLVHGALEDHQKGDASVLRLREVAAQSSPRHRIDRMELYRKTQTALDAFLNGRILKKLTVTTAELYPLPNA